MIRFILVLALLLAGAVVTAAFWPAAEGRTVLQHLTAFVVPPAPPPPFDPAFLRLSPQHLASLPLATRFDAPMGSPHGALTYNAQPFRITRHLGDDLNGIGGQNSDLGDPVYAAGLGRVVFAGQPGTGWGNMIILAHKVPDLEDPARERIVQTVYAHLQDVRVTVGQIANRGDVIGTVGTADGLYLAHLHFEIRDGPYVNPSVGYADSPLNRISPERFLAQYRGAPEDQLNPPPPWPSPPASSAGE